MDGTTGPLPAYKDRNGAIGIYVDGARNIIVERNLVHNNGRGIGIVSETNNFPTQDCKIRNNFVYKNSLAGIYLGGYSGYTGGGTKNCYVVNNTLYGNCINLGYSNEVEGEIRLMEDCFNNVIKNNIVYARPQNGVFVHKYTSTGADNVIDYNLYYPASSIRWIWNGTEYTNFDKWKSACGGDQASTNKVSPLFVSTEIPDLHILPSSPAKNSGLVISADIQGESDIDGQLRILNNQVSKGAHQATIPSDTATNNSSN